MKRITRTILRIPPTLAMLMMACGIGVAGWWIPAYFVPDSAEPTAAEKLTHSALESSPPEVRFQDVALDDALKFISDRSKLPMRRTPAATEYIHDRKPQVSVRLRNAKLGKVLRTMLESASEGALTYQIDPAGRIEIRRTNEPGEFVSDAVWVGELFVNVAEPATTTDDDVPTRQEAMEQITSLIHDVIAVGSWDQPGAELRADSGTLTIHVRNTRWAIHDVRQLMEKVLEGRTGRPPLQIRADIE